MRPVIFISLFFLLLTALLGVWLQWIGAAGNNVFPGDAGALRFLWPFALSLFGGAILLAAWTTHRDDVKRLWRAGQLEKSDMRLVLGLFFGPALALLMQGFVALYHFDVMNKAEMVTSFAILMSVFFMGVGNYMATLRAGSLLGLRTPWTTRSGQVWASTHRFIGRGIIMVACAGLVSLFFVTPVSAILGMLLGFVGVKVAAAIFSYFTWTQDVQDHVLEK